MDEQIIGHSPYHKKPFPHDTRMGDAWICACIAFMAVNGVAVTAAARNEPPAGGLSTGWADAPRAPVTYTVTPVSTTLDHPWSMAFLPDGAIVVTERSGRVMLVSQDGSAAPIFDFRTLSPHPVHTKKGTQAGLFDVLLHPDFDENRMVYFAYAGEVGRKNTLFVVSGRLEKRSEDAGERRYHLNDVTEIWRATPARRQSNHYGGRMVFLDDGTLLVTVGEAYHYREKAQSLDTHFGKIVRLNSDGSVPEGNPFSDRKDALPDIWSYGHRNQQGLIVAQDGRVIVHEHGPRGGDEINIVEPGANYGWPVATYGIDYSGAKISPFTDRPGMKQPLVHFIPSIAPSGLMQYTGAAFPEWRGSLFIGALVKKHVRRIAVEANGDLGDHEEVFSELGARIRDIRMGPDGLIYILTESREAGKSRLLRISPAAN